MRFLIIPVGFFFLAACNSADRKPAERKIVSQHSNPFNQSIEVMMNDYYGLTEAFVNWDSNGVNAKTTALRKSITTVSLDDIKTDTAAYTTAVETLNNDPLIAHEVQPAMTVAALVRADDRLHDEFPSITLPVLIMHGTDDKATVCHGSQFFYDTVGSKDKTLKLYEGHYHDLLNDIGKEQALADIQQWIVARLPVV